MIVILTNGGQVKKVQNEPTDIYLIPKNDKHLIDDIHSDEQSH